MGQIKKSMLINMTFLESKFDKHTLISCIKGLSKKKERKCFSFSLPFFGNNLFFGKNWKFRINIEFSQKKSEFTDFASMDQKALIFIKQTKKYCRTSWVTFRCQCIVPFVYILSDAHSNGNMSEPLALCIPRNIYTFISNLLMEKFSIKYLDSDGKNGDDKR